MFHFDLMPESSKTSTSVMTQLYKRKKPVSLKDSKLVVSFGVGVPRKSRRHVLTEEQTQSLLNDNHPTVHIKKLAAEHSNERTNVWRRSLQKLRSIKAHPPARSRRGTQTAEEDVCLFSQLRVERSEHGLVIDNLGVIAQSAAPNACYASLVAAFATQPATSSVRLRTPKQGLNNFNRGIVQTEVREESYPYNDAGLNGTGQIVGVGDTGVDERSCFFSNADGSLVPRSPYYSPTWDLTKRKVIQYIDYADDLDTEGGKLIINLLFVWRITKVYMLCVGHGTHVCGTIGGYLEDTSAELFNFAGHAPAAKIAFFDMENSANEYFTMPSPVGDNVFSPAYDAGARIHSNSWGGAFNVYDDDTFSVDDFHNEHDDFIALFAAGNDGSEGYYSLGEPSVSKNAMCIGATMSSASEDIESMAYFSSIGPTFDNRIKVRWH